MTAPDLTGTINQNLVLRGNIIVGLTSEQVARINATPHYDEHDPPALIKKVSSVDKGVTNGDSIVFVGTSAYQEAYQCKVDANEWRGSGLMVVHLTGRFTNSTGGTETVSFKFETRPRPPTSPDTALANFGKLQAWTQRAIITIPAIAVGAGTGRFSLDLKIAAEKHTGTTWNYLLSGRSIQDVLPAFTKLPQDYAEDFALDPTIPFDMRVSFKHNGAPNGTTKTFDLWGGHMGLMLPSDKVR